MKTSIQTGILALALATTAMAVNSNDYAVVVSKATQSDKEWAPVVKALVKKHDAKVKIEASTWASLAEELTDAHSSP